MLHAAPTTFATACMRRDALRDCDCDACQTVAVVVDALYFPPAYSSSACSMLRLSSSIVKGQALQQPEADAVQVAIHEDGAASSLSAGGTLRTRTDGTRWRVEGSCEGTLGWMGARKTRSRYAFCCCYCGIGSDPREHPRTRTPRRRWEWPATETAAEGTLGRSASAQVRSSVDCC